MYKICALNKISEKGLSLLGDNYCLQSTVDDADAVLVRSAKMHDLTLGESVKAIGRAGAGVNNIPVTQCSEKGIVVFNTPGANANGVKELVVAGLLLASRQIVEGIEWAKTLEGDVGKQVEKGKSAFAGPELYGKKIGIIGLGAIGVMVANTARRLGMEVIGYDPYLSIDSAWTLSRHVQHATSLDEVLMSSDYLSIHVPLVASTKHMFNEAVFDKVKPGVRLLNFSRDTLVDHQALLKAFDKGQVAKYVTDFPVEELLHHKQVISIPHLGASTPESEENCALMAVKEIKDYLENGNINHSVNMPQCEMSWSSRYRLAIIHKNIPAMIGKITHIVAEESINIIDMINRSRGEWAYTIIDTETEVTKESVQQIEQIADVIKVRILSK